MHAKILDSFFQHVKWYELSSMNMQLERELKTTVTGNTDRGEKNLVD